MMLHFGADWGRGQTISEVSVNNICPQKFLLLVPATNSWHPGGNLRRLWPWQFNIKVSQALLAVLIMNINI